MSSPTKPTLSAKALGKKRADPYTLFDKDALNASITYKHLLSTSMGVHDPLRVIALADSDAFYAACELVRLSLPADTTPLVVKQWEAVIAVSYPARKFGITRMDKAKDAVKKCPDLVVVHVPTFKDGMAEPGYWDAPDTLTHKVSLDVYRRESVKIHSMFKEILPDAEIERASIDEAFFDLTKPVRTILLQRFPFLANVPETPLGLDTPLPPTPDINWDGLGNLIPLEPEDTETYSPPTSMAFPDRTTWHDVALSIGAELMKKVRDEVRVKLGYTTSAGIARNKFLAKLCASYRKPSNQSILRNNAIPAYLIPMPFQKIRNLGGKLGDLVATRYDAKLVGDLLPISLSEIQTELGPESLWVWEILRGIDRNSVKEKASVNKSMLASKNLPKPVTKRSDGAHWIRILASELALRLNDARAINPNLWPKTIVLHAKKGYESARSKQATFPFTKSVTVDVVAAAGNKLWDELVGKTTFSVNNISLAFTGIEVSEVGQQSIAGFLRTSSKPSSSGTPTPLKRPVPEDDENTHKYHCPECGEMLSVPEELELEESERQALITQMRLEHTDGHFAQRLAKEDEPNDRFAKSTLSGSGNQKPSRKRQKANGKKNGIRQFFQPV